MRQRVTCREKYVVVAVFMVLMLAGCHRERATIDPDPLPLRVAGACDPEAMTLMKNLKRQGVKILTIGQDYLVSIPADRLFADQSPRILWGSYAILNNVVCYLKQYRKVGVDVSAFCTKYVSAARERALTSARARAVADYLWSQDIDSRFVFTRGLGSDKPIESNMAGGDNSLNSRIEITFRNAVA